MKYTNYTDYSQENNMYAMHTTVRARDIEQLKYFEELFPEENEPLDIWVRRTARHVHKLTEYSQHQHVYGTKRTWSCHASSRYCFICTLCTMLDCIRNVSIDMIEHIDTPLKFVKLDGVYRLKPLQS